MSGQMFRRISYFSGPARGDSDIYFSLYRICLINYSRAVCDRYPSLWYLGTGVGEYVDYISSWDSAAYTRT